jgi:hypothetical protein
LARKKHRRKAPRRTALSFVTVKGPADVHPELPLVTTKGLSAVSLSSVLVTTKGPVAVRSLQLPRAGAGGRPPKNTAKQDEDIRSRLAAGEKKIAEAVHVEGGASIRTLQDYVAGLRKKTP